MPLRLRLTVETSVPIEVEGLTPSALRGKSMSEIERMPVFHGNVKTSLAELFAVSGAADDERIEFEGDAAGVHWIGAGMDTGEIHLEGNAGRHLGSEMTGGEITVSGDAGDWVGAEMHGGRIHVRGGAGHLVGAAYRGGARGMTGGVILIGGDAGNEIGLTMRRGFIAIGGGAGDSPAFNMLAGTVMIFGPSGIRPGAGMRRGTLALLNDDPPPLLPTFRLAGPGEFNFLRLYFLELRRAGFPVADELFHAEYLQYSGDHLASGKGEVLLRRGSNGG